MNIVDHIRVFPGYYIVFTVFAQVICDDWSEPMDEIWRSYVAYPSGAYQGYWEIV